MWIAMDERSAAGLPVVVAIKMESERRHFALRFRPKIVRAVPCRPSLSGILPVLTLTI